MTYSSSGTPSGSPNSYFRQLPDLDYPSLANNQAPMIVRLLKICSREQ